MGSFTANLGWQKAPGGTINGEVQSDSRTAQSKHASVLLGPWEEPEFRRDAYRTVKISDPAARFA